MTDVFSIAQWNGFYNPPCALEIPCGTELDGLSVKSPKSSAVPPVAISTLGDSVDFGDLTVARNYGAGCSNAHGGL